MDTAVIGSRCRVTRPHGPLNIHATFTSSPLNNEAFQAFSSTDFYSHYYIIFDSFKSYLHPKVDVTDRTEIKKVNKVMNT
jgi:hypothetical protein